MARKKSPKVESSARVAPQKYEMVAIERLKVHPKNPRRGDVPAIGKSVRENGFYGAVIAQKSTGYVLAGNHRYMAATAEGLTSLPVIWLDVDDGRATKIMLADNRASDLADYDDVALVSALKGLGPENLDGSLWDEDDLTKLVAKLAPKDDPLPEVEGSSKLKHTCPQCGYEWTAS